MKEKIIYVLGICFSIMAYSQQNPEFSLVKKNFDSKREQIILAFKHELEKPYSQKDIDIMKVDFIEFMTKLDSIQNSAYLDALIAVKNREDLEGIEKNDLPKTVSKSKEIPNEKGKKTTPEYPGGIDGLRRQISEQFYYNALQHATKLSSQITFVVEENGDISHVKAMGDDPIFNRQAEIAVYTLSDKFSPATINGVPVKYRYRLPLSMNFE